MQRSEYWLVHLGDFLREEFIHALIHPSHEAVLLSVLRWHSADLLLGHSKRNVHQPLHFIDTDLTWADGRTFQWISEKKSKYTQVEEIGKTYRFTRTWAYIFRNISQDSKSFERRPELETLLVTNKPVSGAKWPKKIESKRNFKRFQTFLDLQDPSYTKGLHQAGKITHRNPAWPGLLVPLGP